METLYTLYTLNIIFKHQLKYQRIHNIKYQIGNIKVLRKKFCLLYFTNIK